MFRFTAPTKRSPAKRKPTPCYKVEWSPNSLAKCARCRVKILKGEKRCGIPEVTFQYGPIQRYFHSHCCSTDQLDRLPTSEQQQRQDEISNEMQQRVKEICNKRGILLGNLAELRTCFANRLGVEHYKVFQYRTLVELVVKMPTTEAKLLEVWGIKDKRVESFGSAILAVIRQYNESLSRQQQQSTNVGADVGADDDDNDIANHDDDEQVFVASILTCAEIVNQKFQHAKDNGYVISVD
jgi:HRDC domain